MLRPYFFVNERRCWDVVEYGVEALGICDRINGTRSDETELRLGSFPDCEMDRPLAVLLWPWSRCREVEDDFALVT